MNIAFNGLAYAMVLYLISVGLSVTMGMMGFVNLAHGVFAMAGGYIVTGLMKNQGVPFPLALLGATLTVAAASVPIERLLYRRFYGGDELDQVLLTIGLVFMSVAGATYIWGPIAAAFATAALAQWTGRSRFPQLSRLSQLPYSVRCRAGDGAVAHGRAHPLWCPGTRRR